MRSGDHGVARCIGDIVARSGPMRWSSPRCDACPLARCHRTSAGERRQGAAGEGGEHHVGDVRAQRRRCRPPPAPRSGPGSLHVHPLTRIPTSWHRSIDVGRDHRLPRVHGGVAPPGQLARRVPLDGRASATPSAPRGPRGGSGRPSPAGTTTAATGPAPLGEVGEHLDGQTVGGVEVGLVRRVLDLDVDPRAGAAVEPLARAWGRGQAGPANGSRRSPGRPAAPASWWTTTTPSAVSRASSSIAVGPEGHGQLERRGRVLRRQPRRATMGDDVRHAGTVPLVNSAFVA